MKLYVSRNLFHSKTEETPDIIQLFILKLLLAECLLNYGKR